MPKSDPSYCEYCEGPCTWATPKKEPKKVEAITDIEALAEQGVGGFWITNEGEYIPVGDQSHSLTMRSYFDAKESGYNLGYGAGFIHAGIYGGTISYTLYLNDKLTVKALKALRRVNLKHPKVFESYYIEAVPGSYTKAEWSAVEKKEGNSPKELDGFIRKLILDLEYPTPVTENEHVALETS